MTWTVWNRPATATIITNYTIATINSDSLPTIESMNYTGFFKNVYTGIGDRFQNIALPQIPSINYSSIYPGNIPVLNLATVIFIGVVSIVSLYKLAVINKKVHETASAIEATDGPYHEIRYSTVEEEQAIYELALAQRQAIYEHPSPIICPSDEFSFSTSIDEKAEPIVFSDPFAPKDPYAPKPLPRSFYQGASDYNLRSRPTPRTDKGWYALVQQSTKGPKSGDKRKAVKEGKELAKKRSRNNLLA